MKRGHVRVTLEGASIDVQRIAWQMGENNKAAEAGILERIELRNKIDGLARTVADHYKRAADTRARLDLAINRIEALASGDPSQPLEEGTPGDPGPFYDVLGGSHPTRDGARRVNERHAARDDDDDETTGVLATGGQD